MSRMHEMDDQPRFSFALTGLVTLFFGFFAAHDANGQFLPGFKSNGIGETFSMAVFDDGNGPALYAGGNIGTADQMPINRVGKWDGSSWSAIGGDVVNAADGGAVRVLETLDDGSGPALYAGGPFQEIGGQPASNIARFDGVTWQNLGSGLPAAASAMTIWNDGNGSRLYAGDEGGGLWMWDGATWTEIISHTVVDGSILALAVYDGELYLGGSFEEIDGLATGYVASWDGQAVAALAGGLTATFNFRDGVTALLVHDDGPGPRLFAGGNFDRIDGQAGRDVAAWDGTSWDASVNDPPGGPVRSMTLFDDGGGEMLVVAGDHLSAGSSTPAAVASWDGSAWTPVNSIDAATLPDLEGSLLGQVYAIRAFDDGDGPALHAGGRILSDGIRVTRNAARFKGDRWTALSSNLQQDFDRRVLVFERLSFGGTESLFIGGAFSTACTLVAESIVKLDASGCTPLHSRPSELGTFTQIYDFAVFNDGGGERLIAGGRFQSFDPPLIQHIAAWDGTSWSPLLTDLSFTGSGVVAVYAVEVVDFGSGPLLILAGAFQGVDGVTVNNIAAWDGVAFSPLMGLGTAGTNDPVRALAFYDDGSGPALYVGGEFTEVGGDPMPHLARWDGANWSAVGLDELDRDVHTLEVFDDGGGPELYLGGLFIRAGTEVVNLVAKWNGTNIEGLGTSAGVGVVGDPDSVVEVLKVIDAGDGPRLFVGGLFEQAGGVLANSLAQWDGTRWSAVIGSNAEGFRAGFASRPVLALGGFDMGDGPSLWAGGDFRSIYGLDSFYIGRYRAIPGIFDDDFESGGLSAWDLSFP